MPDDAQRLAAYLGFIVGRPLKQREILEALQMSKTRFYGQRDDGTLIRPDNLVRVARNLNINAVDLLTHFGLIADEEVIACAARIEADPQRPATGRGVKMTEAPTTTRTSHRRPRLSELSVRPEVTPM
ncbi:immunity repressor [Mycobacterium phage Guanica15]|nr:immunity repressor [Mycobacterium phage Guanica15]